MLKICYRDLAGQHYVWKRISAYNSMLKYYSH